MARPCHGLMSPLCLVALAASALLQLKVLCAARVGLDASFHVLFEDLGHRARG